MDYAGGLEVGDKFFWKNDKVMKRIRIFTICTQTNFGDSAPNCVSGAVNRRLGRGQLAAQSPQFCQRRRLPHNYPDIALNNETRAARVELR